jgi:hypothetical protein
MVVLVYLPQLQVRQLQEQAAAAAGVLVQEKVTEEQAVEVKVGVQLLPLLVRLIQAVALAAVKIRLGQGMQAVQAL